MGEKPMAELTLGELEAEMRERGIIEMNVERSRGGTWYATSWKTPAITTPGLEHIDEAGFEVTSDSLVGAIGGALRGRP